VRVVVLFWPMWCPLMLAAALAERKIPWEPVPVPVPSPAAEIRRFRFPEGFPGDGADGGHPRRNL